jgi:MOSC domain-containing protein YiiM
MKLLSVNVSLPKEVEYRGRRVSSGIFKEPVSGRVPLRQLNLEGDGQADLVAHGGVYKAVYAYPFEHYGYWQSELGRDDFQFGQFGENLTVQGMLETDVCVGDVYRVGTVLLGVTQPRVPCFKLGIKMGSDDFLKPFLRSCRVGFYLRVLEEGEVGTSDTVTRVSREPIPMSVHDICHLYYFDKTNLEDRKRAIQIKALSPGWREGFEEQLAGLGGL